MLSVARVGFIEIEIKYGLACICTNACRGIGQHGFHAERGNASGQCIAENATGFRLPGNSGINPDHAGWAVRQQVNTGEMRRSEEHTSELQSLMRSSYAASGMKKTKKDQ